VKAKAGEVRQQCLARVGKITALALVLAGLVWQGTRTPALVDPSAGDYEAYWMAARLLLTGGNPYDLDAVAALQGVPPLQNGSVKVAWNPPWALAVMLPFGLVEFPLSRMLWFLLMVAVLFASVSVFWLRDGGPLSRRWVAALLCILFPPALLALWNGQMTPLLLAGIAGFLHSGAQGRWGRAGAFLALGALKPHLLCLFWGVCVLWGVHHRRWQIAAGLGITLAVAVGAVACVDPLILSRYQEMMAGDPALPPLTLTATTGAMLRLLLGAEKAWLQTAPLAVGACWAGLYYWRRRRSWDWMEHTPLLLAASVIVTPYAWPPDYVLLLPAILRAAARVSGAGTRPIGLALLFYVPVVAACFTVWFSGVAGVWHAWQPWAVLGACLIARKLATPARIPSTASNLGTLR